MSYILVQSPVPHSGATDHQWSRQQSVCSAVFLLFVCLLFLPDDIAVTLVEALTVLLLLLLAFGHIRTVAGDVEGGREKGAR